MNLSSARITEYLLTENEACLTVFHKCVLSIIGNKSYPVTHINMLVVLPNCFAIVVLDLLAI